MLKRRKFIPPSLDEVLIWEFFVPAGTWHFLRIRQWGGHLQKGTILSQVWRNDRWFVGNKKFGVVSHLIVGGSGVFSPRNVLYFSTPMTAIPCIF